VQSSIWTLVPAQTPTLLSSGPATTSALQPTFTFTGRDANGTNDIQRMYFVVNPTPATPQNGCHGFYDRASNAYYLYNDALSAVSGPLSPGSAGTLQNSQCTVYGTGSSVAALTATDLSVSIKIGLLGSFSATNKNVYVWIVDNANAGTGWLQTSTWNLVTPYAPTLFSASPLSTSASPQTFTFVGRDLNGFADIDRMYFLVNTSPTTAVNGCHGFYQRSTNTFYLYNDALTVPMGPLAAASPGVLSNSQCTVYGAGSGQVSASGNDLTVSMRIGLTGVFAATTKTVYVWITDSVALGTGWLPTSTWTSGLISNLTDLQTCLSGSAMVCSLAPSATPYTVGATISISRYNVTLQGGGARRDTMLLRSPSFTGPLIQVNVSQPPPVPFVAGITIQNLTVCGNGMLNPTSMLNPTNGPPTVNSAGMQNLPETVPCPAPVTTLCSNYNSQCIDLNIVNAHTGTTNTNQSNPFGNSGPYSVTVANCDFESSAGHAISLYPYASPPLDQRVNDVYIRDTYVNSSSITGILAGVSLATNIEDYSSHFCNSSGTPLDEANSGVGASSPAPWLAAKLLIPRSTAFAQRLAGRT